jgi:hypothetical protein
MTRMGKFVWMLGSVGAREIVCDLKGEWRMKNEVKQLEMRIVGKQRLSEETSQCFSIFCSST